jgi:hypothetical protein
MNRHEAIEKGEEREKLFRASYRDIGMLCEK